LTVPAVMPKISYTLSDKVNPDVVIANVSSFKKAWFKLPHNNFNKTVNRHEHSPQQHCLPLRPPAPIIGLVDPVS